MTKFIHIRQPSEEGWSPKGGITLAYMLEPKSTAAVCGVSFCSLSDRYSKSIGRSIAGGRLLTQPLQLQTDGVLTCRIIAQIVRTFLVEWDLDPEKFFKQLGRIENRKNPINPSIFFADDTAVALKAQRYPTVWKTILLGPDGTQAVLRVDGKEERTCGWVNQIPRWARKTGWTWI